ncbi:hypothetical protein HUT16_32135 [Kitasatospora sp. NA04385]|uniref:hypothetical protein n=1 Tax=Kitasatospora sp. NA04385 TaxID=2742135 RepID=UPI0015926FEA|nr:hypothetical protein [Kitasatospora sp. NA04385]QKW23121.1 hypothetical protein HUT16_32135 [Kitasatospora sp. NA04385]
MDLRRLHAYKVLAAYDQDQAGQLAFAAGDEAGLDRPELVATLARTAVAHSAGTLAVARDHGVQFVEVFDGFDCRWTSHPDPDKAARTLRTAEDGTRPLAGCRASAPGARWVEVALRSRPIGQVEERLPLIGGAEREDSAVSPARGLAAAAQPGAHRERCQLEPGADQLTLVGGWPGW